MVVVDSRMFVKDSARLSLRGVHGVATGVDFKWLVLLQDGAGAELRPLPCPWAQTLCPISPLSSTGHMVASPPSSQDLGVTRVSSSEGCRMRQVVKVKVELVCDMHFPGWCACQLDLGVEVETPMFWTGGGLSKITTFLSTGLQSIESQLPAQSRQGSSSDFLDQ